MLLLVSGATVDVKRLACPQLGRLLSPRTVRPDLEQLANSGVAWAADNDAFLAWDQGRFEAMLARLRQVNTRRLLWVACPDSVADARTTAGLFNWWLDTMKPADEGDQLPMALVGQDGMESCDWDYWLGYADCFFIGGSTQWKLSRAAADLAAEAKRRGLWVHMGRVNSARRVDHAVQIGCDSIDGSGFSKFPKLIGKGLGWIARSEAPRLF